MSVETTALQLLENLESLFGPELKDLSGSTTRTTESFARDVALGARVSDLALVLGVLHSLLSLVDHPSLHKLRV